MTTTQTTLPASATTAEAGIPDGLTEGQVLAHKRLEAARARMAAQTPLDPDEIAAERYWTRLRRLNGDD